VSQPNIGLFPCASPLSCEVLLARGLTFWASTHAPQSLAACPGGGSTLPSYHARGSPLVMALSWAVSVPGSPNGGRGTSRVRISPSGARLMALKPPFSSLYCCSVWSRLEARRCFSLGEAPLGRRLSWAMPQRGNDSSGQLVDFSSSGPLTGTGRYTSPPVLS